MNGSGPAGQIPLLRVEPILTAALNAGPFARRSDAALARFEIAEARRDPEQVHLSHGLLTRTVKPTHARPADVIRQISIDAESPVIDPLFLSLDERDQTLTAEGMVPFAQSTVQINTNSSRAVHLHQLNRMLALPISSEPRAAALQALIENFKPIDYFRDSRMTDYHGDGFRDGVGQRFNDVIATLGKWTSSLTIEQRIHLVAIAQQRYDNREISFDDAYRLATILTYGMTEDNTINQSGITGQHIEENSLFWFVCDRGPAIKEIYSQYKDRGCDASYIDHLQKLADSYRHGKTLDDSNDFEQAAAAFMALETTPENIVTGKAPKFTRKGRPISSLRPNYHQRYYRSAYIDEGFSFHLGAHKIEVISLGAKDHQSHYRIVINGRVAGQVTMTHDEYDKKYGGDSKIIDHTLRISRPNFYPRIYDDRETDRMEKMGLTEIRANADLGLDEDAVQEGIFLGFQGLLLRQRARDDSYPRYDVQMGETTVSILGTYPEIPENRKLPLTDEAKPESFTFYERNDSGKLVRAEHQLPPRDYFGMPWPS